jgi:hypothetical protein
VWLVSGYAGRIALSGHVPDLGALEVLLGAALTGSLNSVAQQIGKSQQAVSARIRAIVPAPPRSMLVRRWSRVGWHSLFHKGADSALEHT